MSEEVCFAARMPASPRGLQRIAFGDLAAPDQFQRGGAHGDRTARDRFARGDRLRADIHHLHAAAGVHVRQLIARRGPSCGADLLVRDS